MDNFINQFDWEKESDVHKYKLEDGSNFLKSERLPARIIVKIKPRKNDDQTNKRTFYRTDEERIRS